MNGSDVVGGQHPVLPGAVDRPAHPAVVDLDAVDDQVAVSEGDLVVILSLVIVNGLKAVP